MQNTSTTTISGTAPETTPCTVCGPDCCGACNVTAEDEVGGKICYDNYCGYDQHEGVCVDRLEIDTRCSSLCCQLQGPAIWSVAVATCRYYGADVGIPSTVDKFRRLHEMAMDAFANDTDMSNSYYSYEFWAGVSSKDQCNWTDADGSAPWLNQFVEEEGSCFECGDGPYASMSSDRRCCAAQNSKAVWWAEHCEDERYFYCTGSVCDSCSKCWDDIATTTTAAPSNNTEWTAPPGRCWDCANKYCEGEAQYLRDGICDSGYDHRLDFNCTTWNYDDGDCLVPNLNAAESCPAESIDWRSSCDNIGDIYGYTCSDLREEYGLQCDGCNCTVTDCFDCTGKPCNGYAYNVGDGQCDQGAWGGFDFNCTEFNFDDGDCEEEDVWVPCYDCNGQLCMQQQQWSLGDGECDHGVWGEADFNCSAFNFDDGDCDDVDAWVPCYDCAGNYCRDTQTSFIGDGYCDAGIVYPDFSGEYSDEDQYPDYNCSEWHWDGGDCLANASQLCPTEPRTRLTCDGVINVYGSAYPCDVLISEYGFDCTGCSLCGYTTEPPTTTTTTTTTTRTTTSRPPPTSTTTSTTLTTTTTTTSTTVTTTTTSTTVTTSTTIATATTTSTTTSAAADTTPCTICGPDCCGACDVTAEDEVGGKICYDNYCGYDQHEGVCVDRVEIDTASCSSLCCQLQGPAIWSVAVATCRSYGADVGIPSTLDKFRRLHELGMDAFATDSDMSSSWYSYEFWAGVSATDRCNWTDADGSVPWLNQFVEDEGSCFECGDGPYASMNSDRRCCAAQNSEAVWWAEHCEDERYFYCTGSVCDSCDECWDNVPATSTTTAQGTGTEWTAPKGRCWDCANKYCEGEAQYLRDGICDSGYDHRLDFNCTTWNYDDGDCLVPNLNAAESCPAESIDWRSSCDNIGDIYGYTCSDLREEYGLQCDGCNCTVTDCFDCTGKPCNGYAYNVGDGQCDQGAWGGFDFNCTEFNFDDGDCEEEDVWVPCYDCNGQLCMQQQQWSLGDGECDHGVWGEADFNCSAFNFDDGDCDDVDAWVPCYDCAGNYCRDTQTSFIGDGYCDAGIVYPDFSGEYSDADRYPDYNCSEWHWDGGDCLANASQLCPTEPRTRLSCDDVIEIYGGEFSCEQIIIEYGFDCTGCSLCGFTTEPLATTSTTASATVSSTTSSTVTTSTTASTPTPTTTTTSATTHLFNTPTDSGNTQRATEVATTHAQASMVDISFIADVRGIVGSVRDASRVWEQNISAALYALGLELQEPAVQIASVVNANATDVHAANSTGPSSQTWFAHLTFKVDLSGHSEGEDAPWETLATEHVLQRFLHNATGLLVSIRPDSVSLWRAEAVSPDDIDVSIGYCQHDKCPSTLGVSSSSPARLNWNADATLRLVSDSSFPSAQSFEYSLLLVVRQCSQQGPSAALCGEVKFATFLSASSVVLELPNSNIDVEVPYSVEVSGALFVDGVRHEVDAESLFFVLNAPPQLHSIGASPAVGVILTTIFGINVTAEASQEADLPLTYSYVWTPCLACDVHDVIACICTSNKTRLTFSLVAPCFFLFVDSSPSTSMVLASASLRVSRILRSRRSCPSKATLRC